MRQLIVLILTSFFFSVTSFGQETERERILDSLYTQNENLKFIVNELEKSINYYADEIAAKNRMIDELQAKMREREQIYNEKELLYKEAMTSNTLDRARLEGQIANKEATLKGKDREIQLLQQSISDKGADIDKRNREINDIISEKKNTEYRLDTLRTTLSTTEQSLARTSEELKYTKNRLSDCENRYKTVTNKKKRVRAVTGFTVKSFTTPDFALAPKDATNATTYVITNKNTSEVEIDFVTGASFMVFDFSKDNARFTHDAGFYLGFGGKDLFKNFYVGPNLKLYDILHINAGFNVREYELLKSGFSEGDVLPTGISIPTTRSWKVKPYVGFTLDFEVMSLAGKKPF